MPTHIPKQSAMYQNQQNFYAQNQDLTFWQNQGQNVYLAPYLGNQGYILSHQAQMYLPHQLVQCVPGSLGVSQIANVHGQGQTVQFNQDQHLPGQSQQAFRQYPHFQGQIGQQRQLMNQVPAVFQDQATLTKQYGQQGHINNLSQYDQGTSQNGQPVSLPQEQQHLQQGLALQPQVFKPPTPSSLSSQQPQQNFISSTHGQDQIFKSALQQQPVTQAYQGENRFSENYQEEQQRPKSPIISSFPQPDISKNQATADCYPVEEIDVKEQEKLLDQIISEDSVKSSGTAARQSPPKVAPMPPRPNDNEYTSSGEEQEVVEKDKEETLINEVFALRDSEDGVNTSQFSLKARDFTTI
ncbi:putative mediator of RNA polymerase II transcription subunit 26 [Ruditapes philippinarum]|uniref:putative mediator of RNA polymerase II transcription subunit 26 n=1 Tax=Ruditapes philippinarum TaxID=129788 RepID=UPI00295B7938|nr:putative mediator of RNA polymerase II transcription subunit 26 [Ruditapes philippinarum]